MISSFAGLCGLAFALAGILSGCHSFGPEGLKGMHPLYNEAINSSLNEQFIQNLVRLHYNDPTYFLDVTSVAATLKLDISGGINGSQWGVGGTTGSDIMKLSGGVDYTTQPTISFSPLQGDSFVKDLLAKISIENLFDLTSSGWSARRVFGLCIERINDLENAPTASGPKPDFPPEDNGAFIRFADLVDSVRGHKLLRPGIDPVTRQLILVMKNRPGYEQDIAEIKQLLGLDPRLDKFILTTDDMDRRPDTIAITTRSLQSILFYLSHNIESPDDHRQEGLVRPTRTTDGDSFDWSRTPAGSMFRIHQSESPPEKGFLSIPYRDNWYYLADDDLESKKTFMLLTQLFRLQAGSAVTVAPTLTIPVR